MTTFNELSSPCQLWTGATVTTHGITYGTLGNDSLAHRVSYEKSKGPIPKGFVIDHLCRNGLCVNPDHLEAVTNKENILRGFGAPAINARKTECKNGHPLKQPNLYSSKRGKRICRQCDLDWRKAKRSGAR